MLSLNINDDDAEGRELEACIDECFPNLDHGHIVMPMVADRKDLADMPPADGSHVVLPAAAAASSRVHRACMPIVMDLYSLADALALVGNAE